MRIIRDGALAATLAAMIGLCAVDHGFAGNAALGGLRNAAASLPTIEAISCTRDGFRGVREYKNCSPPGADPQIWVDWNNYEKQHLRAHTPNRFRGGKPRKS